jgi:hypothetical protein
MAKAKYAPKSAVPATKKEEIAIAEKTAAVEKAKTFNPGSVATLASMFEASVADFGTLQTAIAVAREELAQLLGAKDAVLDLDEIQANLEIARTSYATELEAQAAARTLSEADYGRKLTRDRQIEREKYEDTIRAQERTDKEKRAAAEADIKARQDKLKTEEAEIVAMRARVAGIDAEIAKAVAKAEAIVKNSLDRDHKHATEMAEAGHRAALANANQETGALRAKVDYLEAALKVAQDQAAQAINQMTEVSKAAFSASAGQINTIASIGRPTESNGPAYPAGRK